jgi:hypothetical protein
MRAEEHIDDADKGIALGHATATHVRQKGIIPPLGLAGRLRSQLNPRSHGFDFGHAPDSMTLQDFHVAHPRSNGAGRFGESGWRFVIDVDGRAFSKKIDRSVIEADC